ncbi:hypothetical protein PS6_007357 [Mucor atramentarius]
MDSTIIEKYYPVIESVWQSLPRNRKITLTQLIDNLEDQIIGPCMYGKKGIDLPATPKPKWEIASAAIIDRLVKNDYQFQKSASISVTSVTPAFQSPSGPSSGSASSSAARKSSKSSVLSSCSDNDTGIFVKLHKLSAVDKENVKLMYGRLDKTQMWKLSTGTVVEEKMKNVAMQLDIEHPAHSLILNVINSCWLDVFGKEERDEIRGFRCIDIPDLSVEADTYLKQLETWMHLNCMQK